MSLAALAFVLGHFAIFGIVHDADEGASVHFFKLIMVAQAPFVAYLAIRQLPSATLHAFRLLAFQAFAALCAIAATFFLT